ncbi:hypothetical protein [Plantactinospora sp. CA-290183]|uniref:hypothetical protein n=1 Tax=Plantactinospora sp. CA-290183 TaxID=3240006 RepID=UPI003D8AC420
MTMLEDSLREMFTARVEAPPTAEDRAGAAIRHGQSVRRRQGVLSALAVAAALVLTIGGVASIGDGWPPGRGGSSVAAVDVDLADPEPSRSVEPPKVIADTGVGLDLWAADQLWTTDGRRLSLAGVGEVTRVYRVATGWVYAGADRVRFLRTDGSSVSLSGQDDRWVLSPDGERLAFQLGDTLYLARIGTTGLAVTGDVPVPADTWPVALAAGHVVISGGTRGYGVVELTGEAPRPHWNTDVTAVYGVRGATLTGLVRDTGDGARRCLATLGVTDGGLKLLRRGACGLGLKDGLSDGRLAPDGVRLAERRATDVALVDVDGSLRDAVPPVSCPVDSPVAPVWADARTVVTGDDGAVVRCRTDGSRQVVPLPAGVEQSWGLVPRLMPGADGR